ncbi:hypothetical protein AAP_03367 [Ascosphaera apis ARSEF 7405]|uniref:Uncharacterized protein n=1 Tax=Ascosphaera apis ARSEF 7405 TaxID=392613 RepID=A0A167YR81_9EURO|nr:hypothetical protein AAP_03367 [Ascosphaera apis ARSEF 7405]
MSPLLNRVSKWCHGSHYHQLAGESSSHTESQTEPPPYTELDDRRRRSSSPLNSSEHDGDEPIERVSTCSTYVEYVKKTKEEEKAERKRRRKERRREEWKKWTYDPNAYIVIF